ncbi:MAG: hypothetical protein DBX53_04395 [Clostridiales bacterium]|nr:MAG: hypothetical protein DBX53_04395 [Clostridiales bacterium]
MKYPVCESKAYFSGEEPFNIHRTEVSQVCLHTHDFIEIAYIENGSGIHILGNQKQQTQQGDLFIMNANIVHGFLTSGGKNKLGVINCIFRAEFLDDALAGCGDDFLGAFYRIFFKSFLSVNGENPGYLRLSGGTGACLQQFLLQMYGEYNRKAKGYEAAVRACLTLLLIHAFRKEQEEQAFSEYPAENGADAVERTIAYIGAHCEKPLHLQELASNVYLSPSYLSKLFKKHTRETLTHFIQRKRVQKVCRLLDTTELSVKAAAGEAGFRDMKTFYEIFKKHVGTTPGSYRRRNDKTFL